MGKLTRHRIMSFQLSGLLDTLRDCSSYQSLLNDLRVNQVRGEFSVVRAARPYLLAALAGDWDGPIVYLTSAVRRAYNVIEQLPVWMDRHERLYRFAEPSALFYDRAPWDAAVIRNRIETLAVLTDETAKLNPVIVASARAFVAVTLPPSKFRDAMLHLAIGEQWKLDKLIRSFVGMGYEPAPIVVAPGTFSRRGGILDIFPLASEFPVRIEFFDDEIDSLRQFNPSDQRSVKRIATLRIVPAREALPQNTSMVGAQLAAWAETIANEAAEYSALQSDIEALAGGSAFGLLEHYLPYVYSNPASLLDYLPDNSLVIIEEPGALENAVDAVEQGAEANRADAIASHQIAADHPKPYFNWTQLEAQLQSRRWLSLSSAELESGSRVFQPGERYGGQLRVMLNQIRQYRNRGDRVVVVTEQVERLANLWQEQDASVFIPTVKAVLEAPETGSTRFVLGTMTEGWSLRGEDGITHCVTDAEIFGWSRPEPRRRREASGRQSHKTPETAYMDWSPGSHVVHVDYGIGRFMGMRKRALSSSEREFLLIEYAGTDTLFVPIHQADRLSRYVGPSETPPKLNKLGKTEQWLKAREKARRNAKLEAKELLEIYRRRAQALGYSFSPDSAWQHEMEARFPFVETEDQVRVIHDVKTDMQSVTPMDRLICGDVGFGKTEVALRAAFKAVQDGMQVAVLVPTTVLAQQHYDNFKARLAAFPVVVEMLSRFRNKPQQNEIVRRIAGGEVDIIIGTHRLLSKDIEFKRIGLMIIDEEQRFGVKHKEHFKKLRSRIDILTLTATPIPRTLYLGLSGIRDISMIQTPPDERLPVITQVGSWDDRLARQAIARELERGGQVFVVHNRVKSIHNIRSRIARLVPDASIAVAHGQLAPRALEKVMAAFSRAEYDVLISTSIIENGIDMPRVNTLIVDRADHFGIAQLYQLRGRVGRSAQQAYAYFFHSPGKVTEEARERLDTLSEHTQLGSGFQVAIRDLELRGSGDILSTRQSGNIESVGLHLYTDMLKEAVQDQKNGRKSTDAEDGSEQASALARERMVIDLPFAAYIPTDWIPEMQLRLQIYRRIGGVQALEDVEALKLELIDRFGQLPAAVEGLLFQMRIKLLAQAVRATHVLMRRSQVVIKLPYLATINRDLLELTLGAEIEVTRTEVRFPAEAATWREGLIDLLARLREKVSLQGALPMLGSPRAQVIDSAAGRQR